MEVWEGDGGNRLRTGRAGFLELLRRGEEGPKPSKFPALGETQRVFESSSQTSSKLGLPTKMEQDAPDKDHPRSEGRD